MVRKVSQKVTDRLLVRKVIRYEDYEIYQYGLEQLFTNVLDVMTLLVIGLSMGMIWQGIVFVFSFMLLRKYAGGYHASTPLKCYLLTTSIIIVVLSVIKYIKINNFVCLGLLIISSVVIFMLSPVDSENKKLDDIERIIYRKKTLLIWSIEFFVIIIFILFGLDKLLVCIIMAESILGMSQIIEMIQKHLRFIKR